MRDRLEGLVKQGSQDSHKRDDLGRWSAEEDYIAHLKAEIAFSGGKLSEEAKASINGRHQLHAELEYFSDHQQVYSLSDDQRDRLIAHTRQDVAHALSAIIPIHKHILSIKRRVTVFCIAIIAILLFIAIRV